MIPKYDARAVAEVLGLAFVRAPTERRAKEGAGKTTSDNVIAIGEGVTTVGKTKGRRLSPPSPSLIEKAVESGLPRSALRHVAECIAGDDKAKVLTLEQGVVPRTTLARRAAKLSPEESQRTERIARLYVQARGALGTDAEAREFMTTPHPELDGRSPIDAAKTDLGTRRTEQILIALEYGLAL
jgi:putative toxin-antitoxin system antitoxin component (TIGR02293 family)